MFIYQNIVNDLIRRKNLGKLPHGIMFVGKKGIGKKIAAISFAKDFFSIDSEKYLETQDMLVIEGDQKEISIDKLRQIKEFLKLKANTPNGKLVIIDSIDDVREKASNSILKLLEEPQPGNYIILICHNSKNILPTIKSRIFEIKFKTPTIDEFCGLIDSANARLLYEICDGSIGAAVNLTDKLEDYLENFFHLEDDDLANYIADNWKESLLMVPFLCAQKAKFQIDPELSQSAIRNYLEKCKINMPHKMNREFTRLNNLSKQLFLEKKQVALFSIYAGIS